MSFKAIINSKKNMKSFLINSKFTLPQSNLIIGNKKFRNIHYIINKYGYSNPLFIVDEGFSKSLLWKIVQKKIKKYFYKTKFIIISGKNEPTYSSLRKNLSKAKKIKFDLIVGVGGGTCIADYLHFIKN